MNRFDKSWAQLQHQSDDFVCIQPFAPKPIYKRKASLVRRIFKAMWLCATTNYRLSTAWAVAGV
ncbi:MAG: hypothetical protein Q7U15_06045 [Methylotenera sp.]|nr:hypothetical protein [Methylotenera sp.]